MNASTYFNTHLMPILARRLSRNERFSFNPNSRYKFSYSTRSQFREPCVMMARNKDANKDKVINIEILLSKQVSIKK